MGRVRNKMVKRASRQMIERYYSRLTFDFDTNKRITSDIASVPSKRVRNKIAGYVTHLMKRIQRGPVRGISLKLQEEERERRMDSLPEKSVLDEETVSVDKETDALLQALNVQVKVNVVPDGKGKKPFQGKGPRRAPKRDQPAKKSE